MEQRGVIKKEGGRREGRGRKAERPSGADLMDAHKHDSPSELSTLKTLSARGVRRRDF